MTEELSILGGSCEKLSIISNDGVKPANDDVDAAISSVMDRAENKVEYSNPPGYSVDFREVQELPNGAVVVYKGSLLRFEPPGQVLYAVHVEITGMDERPEPPDPSYLPFSDLEAILKDSLGSVAVKSTARFTYHLDETLASRIRLPTPLPIATGHDFPGLGQMGLTHIESMILSSRDEEGVSYFVGVQPDEGDVVSHDVIVVNATGVLTAENMSKLRHTSQNISEMLLVRQRPTSGEGDKADG